jgi:hypothetical protein
MAYVNTGGFQLLYAGLQNITFGTVTFTIPAQTFLMHYKTENTSTDVVTASSFLMLMAFNETTTTLFPDSPDVNDVLYSSISFGVDLTAYLGNATKPELSSKTMVSPLTESNNGTRWTWGMRYTNLTAIWWRTFINPSNPHYVSIPVAITRYDELGFSYVLTINKDTHKAELTENHVIGRMRDLWIPWTWSYYNFTGHYGLGGLAKYPDNETIYSFLSEEKIQMSIIQYQTTMLINHSTQSKSGTQNVTDNDVDVSNTDVLTTSDSGEKVFDASFGTKKTYRLYNYTTDQSESTYNNYTAVTRTSKIRGFAFNAVISNNVAFLKFVPYALKDMDDTSYSYYQDHTMMLNVTGANYLYIISYPTYSGYRVVHDPTYTMYYAPTAAAPPTGIYGLIALVLIIAIIVVAVGLVLKRRKPQTQAPQQQR